MGAQNSLRQNRLARCGLSFPESCDTGSPVPAAGSGGNGQKTLQETGLDPKYLTLEITESIAMEDVDYTYRVLQELKEMYVHIALDDFGTGYSSFGY